MAGEAQAAGLPPELPIMCVIQETGIRNLDGGDYNSSDIYLDGMPDDHKGPSRGYFQLLCRKFSRDYGHGRHIHTANCTIQQGLDPYYSLQDFIRKALSFQSRYASLGEGSYGAWIQAVQVSAFPSAYQGHLAEARRLIQAAQSIVDPTASHTKEWYERHY